MAEDKPRLLTSTKSIIVITILLVLTCTAGVLLCMRIANADLMENTADVEDATSAGSYADAATSQAGVTCTRMLFSDDGFSVYFARHDCHDAVSLDVSLRDGDDNIIQTVDSKESRTSQLWETPDSVSICVNLPIDIDKYVSVARVSVAVDGAIFESTDEELAVMLSEARRIRGMDMANANLAGAEDVREEIRRVRAERLRKVADASKRASDELEARRIAREAEAERQRNASEGSQKETASDAVVDNDVDAFFKHAAAESARTSTCLIVDSSTRYVYALTRENGEWNIVRRMGADAVPSDGGVRSVVRKAAGPFGAACVDGSHNFMCALSESFSSEPVYLDGHETVTVDGQYWLPVGICENGVGAKDDSTSNGNIYLSHDDAVWVFENIDVGFDVIVSRSA